VPLSTTKANQTFRYPGSRPAAASASQ